MILPAELFAVQKSCLCSPLAWVHITVTKKSMLGKAWCLKCKERRNLSKADLPNGSSAFCWMSQGPWPQGSCAPSVPSEGPESKAQHGHFAFHTWVSHSLELLPVLLERDRTLSFLCGIGSFVSGKDVFIFHFSGKEQRQFLCRVLILDLFSPQTCSGYCSGQQTSLLKRVQ